MSVVLCHTRQSGDAVAFNETAEGMWARLYPPRRYRKATHTQRPTATATTTPNCSSNGRICPQHAAYPFNAIVSETYVAVLVLTALGGGGAPREVAPPKRELLSSYRYGVRATTCRAARVCKCCARLWESLRLFLGQPDQPRTTARRALLWASLVHCVLS